MSLEELDPEVIYEYFEDDTQIFMEEFCNVGNVGKTMCRALGFYYTFYWINFPVIDTGKYAGELFVRMGKENHAPFHVTLSLFLLFMIHSSVWICFIILLTFVCIIYMHFK